LVSTSMEGDRSVELKAVTYCAHGLYESSSTSRLQSWPPATFPSNLALEEFSS